MRSLIVAGLLVISITTAHAFFSEKYNSSYKNQVKPRAIVTGSFYTKLDHFNPRDGRQAYFRYKLNLEHYRPGGPLYFYINNGIEFSTEWLERGLMYDTAGVMGAALLTMDHRYFGDNIPTETASTENLRYLTIEQALGDIATFVQIAKEHLGAPNAKVIVWGSGYGGSLASWARKRYPHLIDGAWSSSGLYVAQVTSIDFYTRLSLNILLSSVDCAQYVLGLFQTMEYLFENGDENFLAETLNSCTPVDHNDPLDVASFFELQLSFISEYIETYHYRGQQSFCADLQAINLDVLNSFARWVRFIYGDDTCFDHSYENRIELAKNENWNQIGTNSGLRQWLYLRCTQIGLFKTTSLLGVFPNRIPLEYHRAICEGIFEEDDFDFSLLELSIEQLFIQFGGFDQQGTNITFTNGMIDGWFGHGMTLATPNVYNIPLHSRSADLDAVVGWEPFELFNIKNTVQAHIINWSL